MVQWRGGAMLKRIGDMAQVRLSSRIRSHGSDELSVITTLSGGVWAARYERGKYRGEATLECCDARSDRLS
jgi:hypothetical protein